MGFSHPLQAVLFLCGGYPLQPGTGIEQRSVHYPAGRKLLKKGENLLISGAMGCGKSFLACALGRQACLLGHLSIFVSITRLFEDLSAARLDGTHRKYMNRLEKTPLLILDDFGLKMLDAESCITLKEILDDRYRKGATIITSQLPVSKWYELFKEPTHADAIMDRLTAKAHQIELTGRARRRE
jgi:DNA replication protein DnaC